MRGLSAADIVRVWECGAAQHPLDRALTILAAADPGVGRAVLGDLPLGERNRRLLAVRQSTFGGTLAALVTCEQCGARVEIAVPASTIAASPSTTALSSTDDTSALRPVRPLTSRDLAAAARCENAERARVFLAARALSGGDSHERPAPDLTAADLESIAHCLHERDPLAVCLLHVRCSECGANWECELDVAEFVWVEIEAEALRVLRDVHTLASACGWHEADILAMSPLRRRAYLELVQ
jgi:hypothetical protein